MRNGRSQVACARASWRTAAWPTAHNRTARCRGNMSPMGHGKSSLLLCIADSTRLCQMNAYGIYFKEAVCQQDSLSATQQITDNSVVTLAQIFQCLQGYKTSVF